MSNASLTAYCNSFVCLGMQCTWRNTISRFAQGADIHGWKAEPCACKVPFAYQAAAALQSFPPFALDSSSSIHSHRELVVYTWAFMHNSCTLSMRMAPCRCKLELLIWRQSGVDQWRQIHVCAHTPETKGFGCSLPIPRISNFLSNFLVGPLFICTYLDLY